MTCAGTVLAMVATLLSGLLASSAVAEVAPVQPRSDGMVTADALPTAQVDGVVWDQEVVGGTVLVGGDFDTARPAGVPSGSSDQSRPNLMSYTLETGEMTSWNPGTNGPVRAITSSPDGSRVYVGGEFTQADGESRSRVAVFDTDSWELVDDFAPPIGGSVQDIAATEDVVYVGGSFRGVGNQPRGNLAAFDAADGTLLGWAPETDAEVEGLDVSDDGRDVVAGGIFTQVNGVEKYGLAKLDPVSGALEPWTAPIRNGGRDDRRRGESAISAVQIRGGTVYGTGWDFQGHQAGQFEGAFALDLETGEPVWLADCHGDSYDVLPDSAATYVVGHAHYCGNLSHGAPQFGGGDQGSWQYNYAMAWSNEATGTNLADVHGYASWTGEPAPSIRQWFPQLSAGSFTGQYQAAWTVERNDEYVVLGGEFPRVNGQDQQGLVRFAVDGEAPGEVGPEAAGTSWTPDLTAVDDGAVKVSWRAAHDRDDRVLRYRLRREDGSGARTTVATVETPSNWWDMPALHHVDDTVTPGETYRYSLWADDGNADTTLFGGWSTITVPQTVERSAYADAVLADDPELYWPLDETTGSSVADHAGGWTGTVAPGAVPGAEGVIEGTAAVETLAEQRGYVVAEASDHAPAEFTAEAWFRTSQATGRVLGFGDLSAEESGRKDRHVYLDGGRLHYEVRSDGIKDVVSPGRVDDGQWHQVAVTLGGSTMRLYLDGQMIGQRSDVTAPESYVGHWRLGNDGADSWWGGGPGPDETALIGSFDQFSVYPTALGAGRIAAHHAAARGDDPPPNQAPSAQFDVTTDDLGVSVDGSGSADPDGSIKSWAWDFGDGATGSGETALHTYSEAGTYQVELTVTDDEGANATISKEVTVEAPEPENQAPSAQFDVTTDDLGVSVDGSGSADPDGSIKSWAWDFGDGATGSGETALHTYSEAGTYQVELTVTDDKGATATSTRTVTVTVAPPVNQPPSAEFSAEADGLGVSVDGSGSADPDGSIKSWSWDFGDGAAGSGRTASHTYGDAGTYEVALTVTDDKGATATTSRDVKVDAPEITNTSAPTIKGTARVGRRLVASPGDWSPSGVSYSYQWTIDGQQVPGATGRRYRLAPEDYRKSVGVRVTATKAGHNSATATSGTERVRAGTLRLGTKPRLRGKRLVGKRIRVAPGPGRWLPDGSRATYVWRARRAGRTWVAQRGPSRTLRVNRRIRRAGIVTVRIVIRAPGYRKEVVRLRTMRLEARPRMRGTARIGRKLWVAPPQGRWLPDGARATYVWKARRAGRTWVVKRSRSRVVRVTPRLRRARVVVRVVLRCPHHPVEVRAFRTGGRVRS